MRCSVLMKPDVARCIDSALVVDAAEIMRQRNVGFLPVCNVGGAVIGTITDRDIAVRVLAAGLSGERTRVADVLTPMVVSCRADDELDVAEERMSSFQKSRIVCVDAEGRLAGVISLSDIAKLESDGAGLVAASVTSRETAAPGHAPPRPPERRTLECRDVMSSDVACCHREDLVPTIAAILRDRDIGFVPVCDEGGAIVGTLTDRDLTIRVVASSKPPSTTRAIDILTPELVYCAADDPLTVAEDLMAEQKKSRIVCADDTRRPIGIVSLADIARVETPAIVSRILRAVASKEPDTSARAEASSDSGVPSARQIAFDTTVTAAKDIFARVFVPVDLTIASHRAALAALALKRAFGSQVCLFQLAEEAASDELLGGFGVPPTPVDLVSDARGRLRRFIENVAPAFTDTVEVRTYVDVKPPEDLRDEARRWGATLVVAATTFQRLFRSPAEALVDGFDIPVLLLPAVEEEESLEVSRSRGAERTP